MTEFSIRIYLDDRGPISLAPDTPDFTSYKTLAYQWFSKTGNGGDGGSGWFGISDGPLLIPGDTLYFYAVDRNKDYDEKSEYQFTFRKRGEKTAPPPEYMPLLFNGSPVPNGADFSKSNDNYGAFFTSDWKAPEYSDQTVFLWRFGPFTVADELGFYNFTFKALPGSTGTQQDYFLDPEMEVGSGNVQAEKSVETPNKMAL